MHGTIKNGHEELLDFDWTPGTEGSTAVVVIGHGVTANKARPWSIALSTALQAAGIPSLRFSFAGNGGSGGRFEDSTITKQVADLGAVLDAVESQTIIYVGHSMGGAVGVLRAATDDRIKALVSLAGMVHVHQFAQRKFGDLQPGQDCMWDKDECPLSEAYMDDMAGLGSVLDRAPSITVPWLLVHGDEDNVVPLSDSIEIRAAATPQPELTVLPGVDHVFSATGERQMTDAVVPWVARFLGA